jgi:hypothetical protein
VDKDILIGKSILDVVMTGNDSISREEDERVAYRR